MKIDFVKYQGAGNDFVIIDNRNKLFPCENYDLINRLCDRRFGIGADGLMLLEEAVDADFNMLYYNADGKPGSMCGNGGRCIVAFAKSLNLFDSKTNFTAIGEKYQAEVKGSEVSLKMINVETIEVYDNHIFLDTGSPHHVTFTEDLKGADVLKEGRKIRNGAPYFETGTNVNFVQQLNDNTFAVRTYERGVENETLSCGTGVTAVALSSFHLNKTESKEINIETEGGSLKISFDKDTQGYKNIILTGPATFVFKGSIQI